MISVFHPTQIIDTSVDLTASKSISNRLLIIHFLMKRSFGIDHLSVCNDTLYLQEALSLLDTNKPHSDDDKTIVDVGEAGTSFRFLTALLCITPGNFILTGSKRLMERPVMPLVEALRKLGANIRFGQDQQSGPMHISYASIDGGTIVLDAGVSSQFISALMLIAPYFKNGLVIQLKGEAVSVPYIQMTKGLMQQFGAKVEFSDHQVEIKPGPYQSQGERYRVESDWTAASYWYAFTLLSQKGQIRLKGLHFNSLQGDRLLADIFALYGVHTHFNDDDAIISKGGNSGYIDAFDFNDNPDLVQTFAFMHAALKLPLQVNRAGNLTLKETNRITALSHELEKAGATVNIINQDDFYISCAHTHVTSNPIFRTYQDHRMAMSAAILGMIAKIKIHQPEVVSKSYPQFWEHLKAAGFLIEEQ
jgi:3-phosphoshikimate 1-carboxyvinyltransferase